MDGHQYKTCDKELKITFFLIRIDITNWHGTQITSRQIEIKWSKSILIHGFSHLCLGYNYKNMFSLLICIGILFDYFYFCIQQKSNSKKKV